MALATILYRSDPEIRHADRAAVELDGTLRDLSTKPIDVVIHDISTTGARVECPLSLAVGDQVWLGVSGLGVKAMHIVRRDGDQYGCEFTAALRLQDIEHALSVNTVIAASFNQSPPAPKLATSLDGTTQFTADPGSFASIFHLPWTAFVLGGWTLWADAFVAVPATGRNFSHSRPEPAGECPTCVSIAETGEPLGANYV